MKELDEINLRNRIVDELIDYDYAPDVGDSAELQDGIGISEITEFIKDEIEKVKNRPTPIDKDFLDREISKAKREAVPEEIIDILKNLLYWETCPDKYKNIIKKYLRQAKQSEV